MVRVCWILMLAVVTFLCASDISCSDNKTQVVPRKNLAVNEDAQGINVEERVARKFYGNDQWRVVPNKAATNNAQAPEVSSTSAPAVQKRRRLRKRKRRPQPPVFSITEGESEDIEDRFVKRKQPQQRPHRLDGMHEPWKEMEEEGAQRTSTRRRVSPIYALTNPPEIVGASIVGVKRRPVVEVPTNLPDLKMLLKQNGGQSLSEILQQRNLSLADLLRGQQAAILALTDRPSPDLRSDPISEYKSAPKPDEVKVIFKRVQTSIGKDVHGNVESVTEESTERTLNRDIIDAQRKRLSVLYNKENKLYSDVTKYDVITEATTEKRIFVPSHPKYYTSINYRPELEDLSVVPERMRMPTTMDPQPETLAETTTLKKSLLIKHLPKLKSRLPITSAKLMKKVTSPMSIMKSERNDSGETIVPVQATKIDIKDLFGFNTLVKAEIKSNSNNDKGPLKMTIDLDGIIKTTQKADTENIQTNLISDDSTTWSTEIETGDKLKTVSAKDEIMEVLRDEITKEKLTRLLQSRNMTIEELVEQRERGSSQRHLADIFHNETREPESVDEGHIKALMYHPSSIDRQPKNTVLQSVTSMSSPTHTNMEKNGELHSDYGVTSFPAYKIDTDSAAKEPNQVPVWKSVYPTTIRPDHLSGSLPLDAVIDQTNDLFIREMQQIDEIENTIAQAVNEEENEQITNQYGKEEESFNIPYGVKSAIFASLAIIGISLIVFLTILVIFRWTQRQKKRLCYSDSFSCSKSKSPILDVALDPHHRSLRTIMNETLGRKMNVYKAHLQSMSDSWDSDGGKSYK